MVPNNDSELIITQSLSILPNKQEPETAIKLEIENKSKYQDNDYMKKITIVSAIIVTIIINIIIVTTYYYFSENKNLKQPAVTLTNNTAPSQIKIGMSSVFSGPSKELGYQMKIGMETSFAAANEEGGIVNRQIILKAFDDGYEPQQTIIQMKELIENRQVIAIAGNVGTPTAEVAVPYVLEKKIIFFGAFTGSDILRKDPPDRYIFNYRASYQEETEKTIKYLHGVRRIPLENIVVFAQEDSYGDAGFKGVAKAMRAYDYDDSKILRVGYKRNTADITEAVKKIQDYNDKTNKKNEQKHPVQAIVMVPVYRVAAKLIKEVRDLGINPIFTSVSFVNSNALADELRNLGPQYTKDIIVTQVVPDFKSSATGVLKYRERLYKYFPNEQPGFVSLEGYIVGEILIKALKIVGSDFTTEKLVDAFESIKQWDFGIGTTITYGMSEHQGSHKVWGTILDENFQFQSIDME